MSEYRELFAEVADLQPPDRLRRRIAAAQRGRRGAVRARARRPLLIGLGAAATVVVLAGLALVAHSRSQSPGPAATPLTPATVVAAANAHSLTRVRIYTPGPLPCDVLGGASGHSIYTVAGQLDVRPLLLLNGVARTSADLAVVRDPATAARCERQLFATDLRNRSSTGTPVTELTTHMIYWPPEGAPPSQHGVITDGTYDIWGSVGRIVYTGVAYNRADADAVQRSLVGVAAQFAP